MKYLSYKYVEFLYNVLERNDSVIRLPIDLKTIIIHKDTDKKLFTEIDNVFYVERKALIEYMYDRGVFGNYLYNTYPIIALCLDGVIADINSELKKISNWDEKIFPPPDSDFEDFNYLGLDVLEKPNFRFDYIFTNRPIKYKEDTIQWLNRNEITQWKLIIFGEDILYSMELHNVDVLVSTDFTLVNLINTTTNKQAYLYSAPHNMDVETAYRVTCLADLKFRLEL